MAICWCCRKKLLHDSMFVTHMLDTARLGVVRVTPFNWKNPESMCLALCAGSQCIGTLVYVNDLRLCADSVEEI